MRGPFLRFLLLPLLLLWPASSLAGVINVEFHFAPYTGDLKEEHVQTVAGHVELFLNDIPLAGQDIEERDAMVLFEDREISAPIWLPMSSYGALLRKGANKLRVEFKPTDAKKKYHAQLRWSSVMDEATESEADGKTTATNQSGPGVDDRKVSGPVTMEREFQADFAKDQPWHHYPAVTSLTDEDRQALTALITSRAEAFKPDFSAFYALLKGQEGVDIPAIKKAGCLARGYKAGIRMGAAPAEKLKFVTTGQAVVVLLSTDGPLYAPTDMSVLEKITSEEDQMCLGMTMAMAYPPHLVVVRNPKGAWELVK